MDKLEFDDRIRRLERRSSVHTLALSLIVLAIGGAAFFVTRSVPRASAASARYIVATPAPPLPPPTVAVAVAGVTGGMPGLEADLKTAHGLMSRGLITPDDFAAKKAALLKKPLKVSDFGPDVEAAKKLVDEEVLTCEEYDALKEKILEAGH